MQLLSPSGKRSWTVIQNAQNNPDLYQSLNFRLGTCPTPLQNFTNNQHFMWFIIFKAMHLKNIKQPPKQPPSTMHLRSRVKSLLKSITNHKEQLESVERCSTSPRGGASCSAGHQVSPPNTCLKLRLCEVIWYCCRLTHVYHLHIGSEQTQPLHYKFVEYSKLNKS